MSREYELRRVQELSLPPEEVFAFFAEAQTWPWPPGPAVSYQSFGAASVLGGNTPRALEGQGQTAIRGRPIGGPSGLGQTVGHAPNDRHRSSSMAYLRL